MKLHNAYRLILGAAALALVVPATQAQADSCSASASTLITRSSGGTCAAALSVGQEFTLTYRITNASIIDDAVSANDQDPVEATIRSGNVIDATLAQETPNVGGTALPTVLTFIPVCPVGDANAGNTCANNGDCDSLPCGCVDSAPGVTCTADGANGVAFEFGQDLVFGPSEQLLIAQIRVLTDDVVGAPAMCGEFYTRIDGDGDDLETTDEACDSAVTAGAQASADLHAPECASDEDCGDTDCNVCADIDTDNHCEPVNIGSACGTDSDPDDCQTPACVDNAGTGECLQDQIDLPEDSPCGGDDVDCTEDLCNDEGECEHTPDDGLCDDDDVCTTETCDIVNDCVYDFICENETICRSPGYWATHSGAEPRKNSEKEVTNVGQLVIDEVGPIEVCGETITTTSNPEKPYLEGLDLTSSLEGLCMRTQGVSQRQLYRQLVAAAFNCAVSGGDCDEVTAPFMDVSFDDCSDLCEGNPVDEGPSVGDCISALDCFNNGGTMVEGGCAYGNCETDTELYCGGDLGGCPDIGEDPQECIDFPANCHATTLCNEEIGICPKQTPAGSRNACREARKNDCTIDDCSDD